ncbi:MAG: hypothetical protein V3576_00725 [Candidatus Cloacimonadota bacterium]
MTDHNHISNSNKKFEYGSRSLPHMFNSEKPVFITYRLKFSVPQPVLEELERRKQNFLQQAPQSSITEKQNYLRTKNTRYFAWFDDLIANCQGSPQILARDDVSAILSSAFHYHDGIRYKLICYCIMPSHVHVLISPMKQEDGEIFSLQHIIYTWKRFTAIRINQLLQSTGSLWMKESYDRVVRDDIEMGHVIEYILLNPVKAKLVKDWEDWPGSFLCKECLH